MNCPFCDIIEQEPDRILEERDEVIVFLSDPRLMEGHTLIIPKRHVEKLSELNEVEKVDLTETIIKFQERILNEIAPGCDITQHYRPFVTQNATKVDHLHVHLLPRRKNDELYEKVQVHREEVFEELTDKEKREVKSFLED